MFFLSIFVDILLASFKKKKTRKSLRKKETSYVLPCLGRIKSPRPSRSDPGHLTLTLRIIHLVSSLGIWMTWALYIRYILLSPPPIRSHPPLSQMMRPWLKWTQEFESRANRHTDGRWLELSHFAGSSNALFQEFMVLRSLSVSSLVLSETGFPLQFCVFLYSLQSLSSMTAWASQNQCLLFALYAHNRDKWQHRNGTEVCSRFFWAEPACVSVGCVMTQCPTIFSTYSAAKPLILRVDNILRHHLSLTWVLT